MLMLLLLLNNIATIITVDVVVSVAAAIKLFNIVVSVAAVVQLVDVKL